MPALAQVLGATSRLCPDCARTQPISAHLTAATGCRSRPHGARMVSDGLRECGPQASNLRVARSSRAGRAKRDGHFWVVRVSSRPPTVPELCPDGPGPAPTMRTFALSRPLALPALTLTTAF